jgi:hypothetical protein
MVSGRTELRQVWERGRMPIRKPGKSVLGPDMTVEVLTATILLNDQIRYPSLSPKPVLTESISLLARVTISPGPIRSKKA